MLKERAVCTENGSDGLPDGPPSVGVRAHVKEPLVRCVRDGAQELLHIQILAVQVPPVGPELDVQELRGDVQGSFACGIRRCRSKCTIPWKFSQVMAGFAATMCVAIALSALPDPEGSGKTCRTAVRSSQ